MVINAIKIYFLSLVIIPIAALSIAALSVPYAPYIGGLIGVLLVVFALVLGGRWIDKNSTRISIGDIFKGLTLHWRVYSFDKLSRSSQDKSHSYKRSSGIGI